MFKFIIAIFLVEAITELIVKSEIFEPIRKFFFIKKENKFYNFLYLVTDCGYCFSVWAGLFVALLLFNNNYFVLINKYIDWAFIGLFLHRASNVLHYTIDCFRKWSDNGQGY